MTAITLGRSNLLALAGVGAVAAIAWAVVASGAGAMAVDPPLFLAGWLAMMTAMMLPSAAPLVLLYRPRRGGLVAGYLLVWAAIGIPVYGLHRAVDLAMVSSSAVAAVLATAGVYQLTPLKSACLRKCRSPASFLMERFGRSAVRLGVEHGVYCVGCCWGLMAVLIVAGAMGLAWAAAIALVVFAEKVLPAGDVVARLGGVALVSAAALVILV